MNIVALYDKNLTALFQLLPSVAKATIEEIVEHEPKIAPLDCIIEASSWDQAHSLYILANPTDPTACAAYRAMIALCTKKDQLVTTISMYYQVREEDPDALILLIQKACEIIPKK